MPRPPSIAVSKPFHHKGLRRSSSWSWPSRCRKPWTIRWVRWSLQRSAPAPRLRAATVSAASTMSPSSGPKRCRPPAVPRKREDVGRLVLAAIAAVEPPHMGVVGEEERRPRPRARGRGRPRSAAAATARSARARSFGPRRPVAGLDQDVDGNLDRARGSLRGRATITTVPLLACRPALAVVGVDDPRRPADGGRRRPR